LTETVQTVQNIVTSHLRILTSSLRVVASGLQLLRVIYESFRKYLSVDTREKIFGNP